MLDVKTNLCFSVVGINAENDKAIFLRQLMSDILVGMASTVEVIIHPDPDNLFDPNAIAVSINKFKVGYISKADQRFFSLQKNSYLTAKIVHWGVTQNNQAVFMYIQPYF